MKNRIKQKELLDFFRTFSLLQHSRISINNSLELILKKTTNDKLKGILKEINKSVKAGNALSKSFAKYPRMFNDVFIANLKVAEETGEIAGVLQEYTVYIEKMQTLKRKIIQAVRYPLIVVFISLGVIFFMLFFIIPTFEGLFHSSHVDLPLLTQLLLDISKFAIDQSKILFIILFIIALSLHLLFKRKSQLVNEILWKIPIVAKIYRDNILARFSLSMATLLKSKVGLIESLNISKAVTGDKLFKTQIELILKKLIKGESLSNNIISSKFFDITFSRLLAAGEESAELDKVFFIMSNYYSNEFDNYLDNLTSLLEPILIVFVGGIVAIILIALYLPMFEMTKFFGI